MFKITSVYAPQNDAPTAFIGRPIVDLSGNTTGRRRASTLCR
ncbi:hypothetical protein P4S70_08655 [Enterovibrio sp. Hal110]